MIERYTFIPVFSCLLGGLAWWSVHLDSPQLAQGAVGHSSQLANQLSSREASLVVNPPVNSMANLDLLESLDQLATREHYYHSVHGHFTRSLADLEFSFPKALKGKYKITIEEASSDRFFVAAASSPNENTNNTNNNNANHNERVFVTVDQDFNIETSFPLPMPRISYLEERARRQLSLMKEAPVGRVVAEQGIFKGYFKYSSRIDLIKGRSASAIGVRPPVIGIHLELNNRDLASHSVREPGSKVTSLGSHSLASDPSVTSFSTGKALEIEPISSEKTY